MTNVALRPAAVLVPWAVDRVRLERLEAIPYSTRYRWDALSRPSPRPMAYHASPGARRDHAKIAFWQALTKYRVRLQMQAEKEMADAELPAIET